MGENYIYMGDGERLDTYLARHMSDISRSYIKTLITAENVSVNEKKVKAGYILKFGDEVNIVLPEKTKLDAVAQDIDIDIVFEDDDLIIVNKPQGMVVHPCETTLSGTLVNALLYKVKNLSGINGVLRPGIVHRLDKDTSGLLVIAKNDFAHKALAAQLVDKTMHREYYALVYGNYNGAKIIDKNIIRSKKDRKKMTVTDTFEGRTATTLVDVVKRYNGYTLLRLNLKTGRTHQIRVHLLSEGYHIVGDKLYGRKNERNSLNGQLLHSKKLELVHPTSKEILQIEVDLPDYFLDFIKKIEN